MADANDPFQNLSPAEQAEYRRRFPRAGWWIRALPQHPRINNLYQQLQRHAPPQPAQLPYPPYDHAAGYQSQPEAAPPSTFTHSRNEQDGKFHHVNL